VRDLKTALIASLALSMVATATASAASPTVTTRGATAIAQKHATVRADVNPQGKATTYAFQYGTSTAYGSQTPARSAGAGTTTKHVAQIISGLTPGTRYHYRVIASNADGTSTGGDRTFKTALPPARPPTILGTAPFAPSANGLTFTALVNPNGASTTYRFQYGTSTAYGLETFGKSIPAGTVARSVEFRINSLAPRTTYHFRVVASNRAGTRIGPDTIAQTGPFPPGKLEVATRPGHASRSHPYFVTHGRLVLGPGISPAQGCSDGIVGVRFVANDRTVARKRTKLADVHCSFRLRMRALPPVGLHRMRVVTTFSGNAILTRFVGRSYLVRID
jgi:hypothetical protein